MTVQYRVLLVFVCVSSVLSFSIPIEPVRFFGASMEVPVTLQDKLTQP